MEEVEVLGHEDSEDFPFQEEIVLSVGMGNRSALNVKLYERISLQESLEKNVVIEAPVTEYPCRVPYKG
jgi:hypothetical protein